MQAFKTLNSRRHFYVIGAIAVTVGLVLFILLFVAISWMINFTLYEGVNPGPTLIEELRAGKITESDITSVDILKFDPGAGWPFSEREYAKKAQVKINDPKLVSELVTILKDSSTDGWEHRNHPASLYYGILRVNLEDGDHFYLFYTNSYYQGEYYTSVRVGSMNSTNANGTQSYENVPLSKFLQLRDPWYRDVDSPHSIYHVNSPDNAP